MKIANSTIIQYKAKCEWLQSRFNIAKELDEKLSLAQWVLNITSNIIPRTWSIYRAALMWGVQNKIVDFGISNKNEIIEILYEKNNINCKKRKVSASTSRLRYKHLPQEIYKKLLSHMDMSHSKYDHFLKLMFDATVMTGLRPSEWKTLSIKKIPNKVNAYLLKVKNSKVTQDRSFGTHRHLLVISNTSDIKTIKQVNIVFKSIFETKGNDGFKKFYDSLVHRLKYLNNRIGQNGKKKRITIYSARHQFKINMEVQKGCDRHVLAALMGHGSIATAAQNYGRKNKAWNTKITVKPHSSDVQKVIKLNQNKQHNLEFDPIKMKKYKDQKVITNEQP
ncbi:MAG: site-specific integrase [Pseudomonadota bacterium]